MTPLQQRLRDEAKLFNQDEHYAALLVEAADALQRQQEALRKIAEGEVVTEDTSGRADTVIDGKPATAVYVRKLSVHEIARAALRETT